MPGVLATVVFLLGMFFVGIYTSMSVSNQQLVQPGHLNESAYIGKYRMFAMYAADYMAANPTATGPIYWATISAAVAPPSSQQAVMPPDWRIVTSGGSYYLCTSFPDLATALPINGLLATTSSPSQSLVQVDSSHLVIGDPTQTASLATEATLCN